MANFFSNIFNFGNLSKIGLSQKRGSVLAIDIGSSSIKAIQLREDKGRIVLETYGELATGPYAGLAVGQAVNLSEDKLIELLGDLFREANITATDSALAIPLRSSLLMTIDVPKLSKQELTTAVPIEARKFVPVPISEVILDWWEIPNREDLSPAYDDPKKSADKKTLEVLIAAIHRDTVQEYQEIGQKMKLNVEFFEIETFSAIRAAMRNDLAATAIVDFGAGTTKVAVIDYGVVRLSHTISKGSQDVTLAISRSADVPFDKAEEIKRTVGLLAQAVNGTEFSSVTNPIVEYIFAEINKLIASYQKKTGRAIGRIIMIGGGALLKGLPEAARKNIEIPIALGTPFDKIDTPAFLEDVLTEAGPSFAVSIGLAMRKLEDL